MAEEMKEKECEKYVPPVMQPTGKLARYKKSIVPADPIKRYIQEVNRYPILTKDEEERLIKRYLFNHDAECAKKLLLSHLRLVVRIAFEYYNKYFCSLFDLIQEGNVGLMFAIKKFDPEKKVRLSTYAQWWIRAYILKYLMDNYSLIRIGHSRAEKRLFYSLKKAKEKLTQMGFDPTNPKMLAEFVKEDEKDV
ncbi:MAG: sigma-70 family RNA polymerase sigma factor, partial [Spirochaetes bacterium]|nr:sigma-70 family RNA polymerase sigma factor [Spirochaetota bacterium]